MKLSKDVIRYDIMQDNITHGEIFLAETNKLIKYIYISVTDIRIPRSVE